MSSTDAPAIPDADADAADPQGALGGGAALFPARSIAGRALVTVIAIMTFLAAIAAGGAQIVAAASEQWTSSVASEATIQVKARAGRDIDADVARAVAIARAAPGVSDARPYSRQESEALLEPWLGSGLELGELPVPRMIVLSLASNGRADLSALARDVNAAVPSATLDDHRLWVSRLATMANAVVVVAVLLVLLVLAATALAVAFATRGAVAANRDIVEVLHFVGAEDSYIGREFGRHFLRLGLEGGGLGAAAAVVCLWIAGFIAARFQATPGGDQIEALFGGFALGLRGFLIIALLALVVAGLTAHISRRTVFRHLTGLA
ncbi:MAG: cell division protein FtsX [Rhizobiales bacterium 65-9]|nr:ABC transporter permease [Hyphomicrobiales bacterium]OJY36473.1 MAG: cell division protein FtsX [Rhizobiales bacterium 65-9]